jgi:hypothetical protein
LVAEDSCQGQPHLPFLEQGPPHAVEEWQPKQNEGCHKLLFPWFVSGISAERPTKGVEVGAVDRKVSRPLEAAHAIRREWFHVALDLGFLVQFHRL